MGNFGEKVSGRICFPNIVCSILELCDNLDNKIISNNKCYRDKDSNFYYRDDSKFAKI